MRITQSQISHPRVYSALKMSSWNPIQLQWSLLLISYLHGDLWCGFSVCYLGRLVNSTNLQIKPLCIRSTYYGMRKKGLFYSSLERRKINNSQKYLSWRLSVNNKTRFSKGLVNVGTGLLIGDWTGPVEVCRGNIQCAISCQGSRAGRLRNKSRWL